MQCLYLKHWQSMAHSVPNMHQYQMRYASPSKGFSKFDEVVIAFDNDEAGRKRQGVCEFIASGKAKIANLPKKTNEMLIAGQVKEITTCLWQAKPFRPMVLSRFRVMGLGFITRCGIIVALSFGWTTAHTWNRRGDRNTFCAGSVSKVSISRRRYHLLLQGETVGYVARRSCKGRFQIHVSCD